MSSARADPVLRADGPIYRSLVNGGLVRRFVNVVVSPSHVFLLRGSLQREVVLLDRGNSLPIRDVSHGGTLPGDELFAEVRLKAMAVRR